jgi:transposase-like protein
MTEGKTRARNYTLDFRQQAMALADELGSYREAAEKLGMPANSLYSWLWKRKQDSGCRPPSSPLGARSSPPTPSSSELQDEVRSLRKELERERKVNQILKSAAAFFSQDHLK